MKATALFLLAMVAALGFVGAAQTASYTLTVGTNASSYVGPATIAVSGQVSPAPGPNSSVVVRVFNPEKALAVVEEATVNATTGLYGTTFVAGGSPMWVNGDYLVNATWGAYGPTVFATTSFSWALSSTTTSSTSTTSSSSVQTTTTSSSVSTTSSQSVSANSSSSSSSSESSTISTSTSTSSAPPTSSSSSASTTSGGAVPAFPPQALAVIFLTAVVLIGYLLLRRSGPRRRDGVWSSVWTSSQAVRSASWDPRSTSSV